MSVEAQTWAYAVSLPRQPCAKSVLVSLANRADEQGYCYPGIGDLQRRTEWGRSTIQRAMKLLMDQKLLSVSARYTDDGRQRTNLYRLAMGPIVTTICSGEGPGAGPSGVPERGGEGPGAGPSGVPERGGEGPGAGPESSSEQSEEQSELGGAHAPEPSALCLVPRNKSPTGHPRGHRASVFPEDWDVEPWMGDLCRGFGLNAHAEFRDFRNHHTAKGSRFVSWPHAFRTWVSRSVKYARRPRGDG